MTATTTADVAAISSDLQALQRQRAITIKSRVMQANRLQAVVAGTLGYSSGMAEKDRLKKFAEASALIKAVAAGKADSPLKIVILTTLIGIDAFDRMQADLEKAMVKQAKRLPVAAWVKAPQQRGFGLLFLAIVVGECGDLANYANPGKLWRRLGCAPWSFGDRTAMGATWRAGKEGKLPAEEWARYGYSPRRRSIAYLIGEGIVKQNTVAGVMSIDPDCWRAGHGANDGAGGDPVGETDTITAPGPYRLRYDEAKAAARVAHPDWPPLRCHRHAMLLATKRLLRELWVAWRQ